MKNVIIPEIVPDVEALRDSLAKELSPACRIKIPPLNRKAIRVVKSLGIVSEVHVRPNKIIIHNTVYTYAGLATFFFLPFGIYLISKMKDGEALRASVHDIILRATRKR